MFQSNHYQQVFVQNQLTNFEAIWAHDIAWFEPPNQRRDGWSGVGAVALQANSDEILRLFIKKQQNHGRLSLRHPIAGEPTFRREFQRLKFLEAQGFVAPKVVFYAENKADGIKRAILITEALADYLPLDEVTKQMFEHKNRVSQTALLRSVAVVLRQFHALGLMHRALYPKHIFVKILDNKPQIALIDLEKARFSPFFLWRAYFDLAALHRHSKYWRASQKMRFFLEYMQIQHLSLFSKWFCCQIIKRATRT